ncbi:hypothetical protein GOBAR_DD24175 [Gossypium barbadense]|nr:hypothetical protein GOBAR_DD24175 [Gossypium barbadense]
MYCESDQAILCWDCDSRVHGANFLVAKHSRTLLCHLCQSPTPWNGSGPKLGPTVSVCENCVSRNAYSSGDEENQVVPWTSGPPVSSSSTSEECSTRFGKENGSQSRTVHPLKRMRETEDPFSPLISFYLQAEIIFTNVQLIKFVPLIYFAPTFKDMPEKEQQILPNLD